MLNRGILLTLVLELMLVSFAYAAENGIILNGEVVDADTGEPVACRIYIQDEKGKWYFPKSTSPNGSAVVYEKRNWANKKSVEFHTTVSAHPFTIELPSGQYTITIERGKEYLSLTRKVTLSTEDVDLKFQLKRWIDMARLGWYSGDTHVHRTLQDLPNVQLAEDLNVSFPLLYWVTKAFIPPDTGDKSTGRKVEPKLIFIDDTHVIYPLNTEYEIFSVNSKRHTLGAVFVLNHKSVFQKGVPPVAPIAGKSRLEGGLLELDKHNWPWSMMLVPIMNIDLFELANNHMWRTEFAFSKFGEAAPEYMEVETNSKGFTELGWIDYGFKNYYALLNCGFRLRPTAGTASGVHPVPLGFGRVYVKLKNGFNYEKWIRGLNEGRSFVTTGPMLLVTINNFEPGHIFRQPDRGTGTYSVAGVAQSAYPLERIEILVNGLAVKTLKAQNTQMPSGGWSSKINEKIDVSSSCWIAVRCYERRPNGRIRFGHTGPFHVEVDGKPLRPRKQEIGFLIKRMQVQIERNKQVLSKEALDEYHRALNIYQKIAGSAR
ncbi:MAG: hypothetical protein GWN67_03705 [Phycisphaerae bacterium]|nr:hypothetical protein [Phycisphaerae bacterium]NIS50253.1 hypothetical protein [Phycisphaerae bacterium]NIU07917.1 hypothetical protein [Phycisphaerae bacterium]NIU55519.1 hypothetical protein [Phycisphaerae bacterium]NIU99888.1 hypothetical protein [Phycisphaerae bacterium]